MKRPWNIIDSTVYSLATYQNERVNMNICTYVSVISLKPKIYAIAIDQQTQTYLNLKNGCDIVLQVLNTSNIKLVRSLGKKSGKAFDKNKYLNSSEYLTSWNNFKVINNANAYLELTLKDIYKDFGDHDLFLFDIKKFKTNSEDNILTFQDLIKNKIIL